MAEARETISLKQEPKVAKELKFRMLPEGLYIVFYEGGGELPQRLSGRYTSVFAAQAAIDNYKKEK